MDYRVDPKGKVFTTHVTKRNLAVTLAVGAHTIRGNVYLLGDNRLKDEMNNGEDFIAVTDARIYPLGSDQSLYTASVLIINKSQVGWIFPDETLQPDDEPSD